MSTSFTPDPLQHDPRTKQQIKNAIYETLYTPIEEKFQKRLHHIIMRNAVLGGYSHASFMYKNTIYNCDPNPLPRKMNRLMPAMQDEMNQYLRDLKRLNEQEVAYVLGYINQVLNASNDFGDYLRLLPHAVHAPIEKLAATCPCHHQRMSEDTVALLQTKNKSAIELMKQRMVANLII